LHRPGDLEFFLSLSTQLSASDQERLAIRPVVGVYTDSGEMLAPDGRSSGNHHGEKTCPRGEMSHFCEHEHVN